MWEFISDTTRNQILEFLDAPSIPIVVGVKATYPLSDFWKASTIKLEVNSEDWTPISFPIDVRCITSDLSGVGHNSNTDAPDRVNHLIELFIANI